MLHECDKTAISLTGAGMRRLCVAALLVFLPAQAAVANVFEPDFPQPLNPFIGGGGIQDTRIYSSRDGGRHWLTQKLDQGGLGRLEVPIPGENSSPEFS